LALFILSIPFSVYASEIKAFLKIPPQRIGVWILKARLSSSESRLMELDRIRKDVNYAHFRMYLSYVVLGLIILISAFYCALTLFEIGQQENLRQWGKTSNFYLLVPLVYFALYRMAVDMRLMRNAYKDEFAIEKLESHIETLSKRLQPYL